MYQRSDYKNVRTTDFGKYSERFDNLEYKSTSNSPGKSSRGKIQSALSAQVKKRLRDERNNPNIGPGSYEIISDFGRYDATQLSSTKQ